MKISGILSLAAYFSAVAFVAIAEELHPGASGTDFTAIVFVALVLLGAMFAFIQNDDRWDKKVLGSKGIDLDEEFDRLEKMILERKKELSDAE